MVKKVLTSLNEKWNFKTFLRPFKANKIKGLKAIIIISLKVLIII